MSTPVYTQTAAFKKNAKLFKQCALARAPLTPEEQAARDKKQTFIEARRKEIEASNAAFMAAYRAAHPLPEIVTGSPYQAANEAWRNGQPGTDGLLDHWTSSK
jgi:hypothetical protein